MDVDSCEMDVDAYLNRLGNPESRTLDAIIQAHLAHIPFENFDTYGGGRKISLSVADTYEKIITRKRGGFCFEVNLLLGWILRKLGYEARYLASRVYRGSQASASTPVEDTADILDPQCPDWDGELPPTHIVVLVDGKWLCDIGFGEPPRVALDVTTETEQFDGQHRFKIVTDGKLKVLSRQSRGASGLNRIVSKPGVWESRILLDDNTERPAEDFVPGLTRVQTDDTVIFRQFLMCVAQTDSEKIVLTGNKLKITPFYADSEQVFGDVPFVEKICETPASLKKAIREKFGIAVEKEETSSTEVECVDRAVDRVFSSS